MKLPLVHGEEGPRAKTAEQDAGVAARTRQRTGRPKQPRVCSRFTCAARGPRDPQTARVLWQIWENSQSSYKSKSSICGVTESVGVGVRDVRVVGRRVAGDPGRQQRDTGRARAQGLARHHQVLR
ncbi:unnamed protein product [Pieris macdunnoughi]|uniref:Uncharacterized protein n=1 Tax=Pieris macdunnoughi TaxID=345717 RepID=A0A821W937_9NEOP|nr:unnamed protein product [Pieris macdunnoughi]